MRSVPGCDIDLYRMIEDRVENVKGIGSAEKILEREWKFDVEPVWVVKKNAFLC